MPNLSLTNSYMSKRKGVLLLLLSAWVGFCLVWFFTIYQKEEKKSIEDMAMESSQKGSASAQEPGITDTGIAATDDTTLQKKIEETPGSVLKELVAGQDNKAAIDSSERIAAKAKDSIVGKQSPTPVANTSEESKRIAICYFRLNSDRKIKNFGTRVARNLRRYMEPANTKIIITGHTDCIGASEFNYQLGLQRAERVKQLLIKKGIAAERIVVLSKGEEQPVANNKSSRGRAQNRRVEINITLS
jgi:outer membrane protein OmpA-like peptidoglycan-associated protein